MLGACLVFSAPVRAQVTYYWDINDATVGASTGTTAAGTWSNISLFGLFENWSTDSTGQSNTAKWSGGIANFSAGANATGAYTVNVFGVGGGVSNVEGIVFEEGDVTLAGSSSITLAGTPVINVATANATISAALAGSTGFTKTGSGNLVLSGANTYTGTTTINAGTLSLGASNVLPSSGDIVLGGGSLNLGDFTHTLGSLTVTADSILDFGSGASVLNLNSVAVSAGVTLTITNWTDTVDYFYSMIDPGLTTLGRIVFSGFSSTDTKWQSYNSQITPVPEPSFYGAVLLGLCSFFAGWRRHREFARRIAGL